MNRKESISVIVLLSFSAAVSYQASRYPFGTLSNIGPGFLPFYLGLILAIFSIIILIKTILKSSEEGPTAESFLTKKKVLRVGTVFLSMGAYAFLMGKLGFPITTFLFTLALFKFVESYPWIPSTFGALATSILTYLVFGIWLQCQFPMGWLGL